MPALPAGWATNRMRELARRPPPERRTCRGAVGRWRRRQEAQEKQVRHNRIRRDQPRITATVRDQLRGKCAGGATLGTPKF